MKANGANPFETARIELHSRLLAVVTAEDALAAAPAPDLRQSFASWERRALHHAGHDNARVADMLAERMTQQPYLFGTALAWRHTVMRRIVEGRWGSVGEGADLPYNEVSDTQASREVSVEPMANLWTLTVLAIRDAQEVAPERFGRAESVEAERRARGKLEHAVASALAHLAEVEIEDLVGFAYKRGLAIEPERDLGMRLVRHVRANGLHGGAARPRGRAVQDASFLTRA